jgi:hypothetical protein
MEGASVVKGKKVTKVVTRKCEESGIEYR